MYTSNHNRLNFEQDPDWNFYEQNFDTEFCLQHLHVFGYHYGYQ